MAVEVNTTRKAVEISWDSSGDGAVTPEPPIEFPPYPDNTLPGEQPYPDQGLPGEQPRPDNTLPGEQPEATHPIYLPPYIDNSLPQPQPHPDHELPEIGLSDEQKQKIKEFLTGNLPPFEHPAPVHAEALAVQVFAQGQEGDWSNTAVMPNDGLAVLTFPQDFTGESYVEVRSLDGELIDCGTISVK